MVFEKRICEKCGNFDFGEKLESLGTTEKFWDCPECKHRNIEK